MFLVGFCVPALLWLNCWGDAIEVGSVKKAPAVSRLLLKPWCLRDAEEVRWNSRVERHVAKTY